MKQKKIRIGLGISIRPVTKRTFRTNLPIKDFRIYNVLACSKKKKGNFK